MDCCWRWLRGICPAGIGSDSAPVAAWLAWPRALVALLLLTTLGVSFIHFRETPPPEQTLRSAIAAPENSTVHSFAISPDGRTLVIAAAVNGKRQLWLRPMDALQAQPMAFTEDATYPFWSPDSRYIGFFAQGKLKKVAASGGPAQSLCDVPNGRGGSWNRDDVIVFSPSNAGISIQRVAAAGGVPVDVTKTKGNLTHPVFLPDGRHFLYLLISGDGRTDGHLCQLARWKREPASFAGRVERGVRAARARRPNRSHSVRPRKHFDGCAFRCRQRAGLGRCISGGRGCLLDHGQYLCCRPRSQRTACCFTRLAGYQRGDNQIGWYDRTGKSLGPVGAPGAVLDPAISPDEKSVVFRRTYGGTAGRSVGAGSEPWNRDAVHQRCVDQRRALLVAQGRPHRLRVESQEASSISIKKPPAEAGRMSCCCRTTSPMPPSQWSRDGRFIVYFEIDPKTKNDLWVLPTEGAAADRKPIPFLRTEFNEMFGQLSPDSHWMAFTSDRSGRREVYVRPFPPGEGEWTISIAGGEQPRWRGDGKELFFEAADGKMMAVPVKAVAGAKPSFEAGNSRGPV